MFLKTIPVRTFLVEQDSEEGDGQREQKEIMISCESAYTLMQNYPESFFSLSDNSIFLYVKDEEFDYPFHFDGVAVLDERPPNCKTIVFPKSAFRRKELEVMHKMSGHPTRMGNWIFDLEYITSLFYSSGFATAMNDGLYFRDYSAFLPMVRADMQKFFEAGWTHLILSDEPVANLLERRKTLGLPDDPALAVLQQVLDFENRPYVDYQIPALSSPVKVAVGNSENEVIPGQFIALFDAQGIMVMKFNRREYVHYGAALVSNVEKLIAAHWLILNFDLHYSNILKIMANS